MDTAEEYQNPEPLEDGFVLAWRNIRDVELREAQVSTFAGIIWILTFLATFLAVLFGEFFLIGSN